MNKVDQKGREERVNRFPRVVGVRLGYDPKQVDELIRKIEQTLGRAPLGGPPVTADEIRAAKFGVKRGGYNETAVDFALDAFIVAVETRAGQTAEPPSGSPARPDSVPAEEDQNELDVPERQDSPAAGTAAVTGRASAHAMPAAATAGAHRSGEATDAPAVRQAGGAGRGGKPDGQPGGQAGGERGELSGGRPGSVADAGAATWLETQAARVELVAFRPGRLGMGYKEDEVDAFLDRVVATLRGTTDRPVTPEQVREATFATVVFRAGYAIGEVDGFLAEIADILERQT